MNDKQLEEQNHVKHLIDKLDSLCEHAKSIQSLIEANYSCEDILMEYTKIKKTTSYVETLLLNSQLINCLLPSIPYMGQINSFLQRLKMKGLGALIVIERNNKIEEMISQQHLGVPIDAKLSAWLLESIFLPDSPLHDGAVVIKKDRIFTAGCVLPLSKQLTVGRRIGTRHRAALGLSETCDAITFVLSEETGKISIAFKGELFTINEDDQPINQPSFLQNYHREMK